VSAAAVPVAVLAVAGGTTLAIIAHRRAAAADNRAALAANLLILSRAAGPLANASDIARAESAARSTASLKAAYIADGGADQVLLDSRFA